MNPTELAHLSAVVAVGAVTGFVVCLPIGPVNLTVINTALRKGFLAAFLVGGGSVCADLIYVSLALTGHATLPRDPSLLKLIRGVAVLVVAGLGVRNLLTKAKRFETNSEATAEKMDVRWHHPRSFLLGFLLAISNLGLIVLWATVTTALDAHDLVDIGIPISRWACASGVAIGAGTWFLTISWVVSRAHRRIKPETLAWLARLCGGVFLFFAGLLVWNLFFPRV